MEWYFRASLRKIWLLCVCLLGYILFFLFYLALCVRITAFVAKTLFWLTILNFRASFAHVSFGNRIWTVKNLHILCLENINRNIACGWKCRNYVIFIYHVVCDYYNFLSHTKKEHKHIHTRRSRTNSFGFLQNPLLFFMGSEWTELKFFTPKKKNAIRAIFEVLHHLFGYDLHFQLSTTTRISHTMRQRSALQIVYFWFLNN